MRASLKKRGYARNVVGEKNQYLGGAPEEETHIFAGPDVSWEMEWKEFTAAIREGREPLGGEPDACGGVSVGP